MGRFRHRQSAPSISSRTACSVPRAIDCHVQPSTRQPVSAATAATAAAARWVTPALYDCLLLPVSPTTFSVPELQSPNSSSSSNQQQSE